MPAQWCMPRLLLTVSSPDLSSSHGVTVSHSTNGTWPPPRETRPSPGARLSLRRLPFNFVEQDDDALFDLVADLSHPFDRLLAWVAERPVAHLHNRLDLAMQSSSVAAARRRTTA